jgi:hypothetical protein
MPDGVTQDIYRELRQLKLLVLQQGIELQNMKVARLERELTELQRADKYVDEQAHEFDEYAARSTSDVSVQTVVTTNAFLENVQTTRQRILSQTIEREKQLQDENRRLAGMVEVFRKEQAKAENSR